MLILMGTLNYEEVDKFNEIFGLYKNYLLTIANFIVRDLSQAEDIVQDAFIRIIENLDKIDRPNSKRTKGFVSIITRNLAISRYNKNKKTTFLDEDMFKDEGFENEVEKKEEYEQLLNMIRSLNDIYADVLILSYVHELKDDEIAKLLDITKENVRKRRERAKKMLLDRLNGGIISEE